MRSSGSHKDGGVEEESMLILIPVIQRQSPGQWYVIFVFQCHFRLLISLFVTFSAYLERIILYSSYLPGYLVD